MNNNQLYHKIMNNVSKRVIAVLNEEFAFENNELGDKILNIFQKDQRLLNIVKDSEESDFADLFKVMKELTNKELSSNPKFIQNNKHLAIVLYNKLGNDARSIKFLSDEDTKSLIEYICVNLCDSEETKNISEKTKDVDECGNKKACNDKSCFDKKPTEECNKPQFKQQEKESIKESRRSRYNRIKSLNEGFKTWKEEVKPKFDNDKFKVCLEKFYSIIEPLLKEEDISAVSVSSSVNEKSVNISGWIDQDLLSGGISGQQFASDIIAEAKSIAESNNINYVELMRKSYIAIRIVKNSYLFKYIQQEADASGKAIKNYDYLKIQYDSINRPCLLVTSINFIDHFSDIVNFFA